jgi:hypothetical protein
MSFPSFATGEVLTAADMNAVGLWLIKTDTLTSGSSKEITSCFSSLYRNYRIIISNARAASPVGMWLRFGTTATGVYYYNGQYGLYNSATITGINGSAQNQIDLSTTLVSGADTSVVIDVFSPNLAKTTTFSSIGNDPRTDGGANRTSSGFVNNTTQYTSFTLLNSGGVNWTSCDIAVYGYKS